MDDTEKNTNAVDTAGTGEDQDAAIRRVDGDEEIKKDEEGEDTEVIFETNWTQQVDSFDEMGLKEELLRGIYAFGFQSPSKIQEKGVLPVIQGRDTIA